MYDTLPLIDGNRQSGNGILAGGYFTFTDGTEPQAFEMRFTDCCEQKGGCAEADYGELKFLFAEEGLRITGAKDFTLEIRRCADRDHIGRVVSLCENEMILSYQNVEYRVKLTCGKLEGPGILKSCDNTLELCFF